MFFSLTSSHSTSLFLLALDIPKSHADVGPSRHAFAARVAYRTGEAGGVWVLLGCADAGAGGDRPMDPRRRNSRMYVPIQHNFFLCSRSYFASLDLSGISASKILPRSCGASEPRPTLHRNIRLDSVCRRPFSFTPCSVLPPTLVLDWRVCVLPTTHSGPRGRLGRRARKQVRTARG